MEALTLRIRRTHISRIHKIHAALATLGAVLVVGVALAVGVGAVLFSIGHDITNNTMSLIFGVDFLGALGLVTALLYWGWHKR